MIWLTFGILVCLFTYTGSPQGPFRGNSVAIYAFQFSLVLVLSYMTGMGGLLSADHNTYASIYREASNLSLSQFFQQLSFRDYSFKLDRIGYEIGYVFFSMVCGKLGLGVAGYFFAAALITNTFVVKTVYRFKYPVFCILIFIASRAYLQEANIVRQTMAISIYAYALKFIQEKKFKKYLLFIILAASIHSSLIITLPLYLLVYIDKDKKNLLFYVLACLWAISLIIANSSSLIGLSFLNATAYGTLLEESEISLFKEVTLDLRFNIFTALLLIFTIYSKKRIQNYDEKDIIDPYFVCTIIGCIFCNISVNAIYFFRISLIFDIIYCFYLGTALNNMRIRDNTQRMSYLFIFVLVFKVIAYFNFCLNNNEWIGKSFYSINDLFL